MIEFEKGLDRKKVIEISKLKKEPKWMLEYRLDSYEKFINIRPPQGRRMFEEGERIYSSYERAKNFMQNKVPYYENSEKYVVFKPLEDVDENDRIKSS